MIYSVISHLKRELYESTQYHITNHTLKKSETICFSEKDLKEAEWKEEKEFTLNGFSYDVIKISIVNGKKYFFCYIDKKDIIINSLFDFSKKIAVKKIYLRRQIDFSTHGKKTFKISNFFIIFGRKEFYFFTASYLKIIYDHYKQLESTLYFSIILPPPENFILK